MLNIVLFGPPGAGKGTQSLKIAKRYNLIHLSTGDILRSAIERKTPNGILAQDYMDRGDLVPDELVVSIIGRRLDEHKHKTNGFIFDGFPRTTLQAQELDNKLETIGCPITLMLGLEVDYNELITRLQKRSKYSGRIDDQDIDIVKNRISVYSKSTRPVMEYYKSLGKYFGVNGMGTIDEIFERICKVLDSYV